MPYNNFGELTVKSFTAGGALPVVGAVVRILGADEENRDIEYSVLTDIDGGTERILLPAPSAYLSMSPGAISQSYAKYNVELLAEGFYPRKIFDVAVFADNSSFQSVEMIPLYIGKDDIYPHDILNSTVTENEYLE